MILLLFIVYEGFLILPEKMVVHPGVFRMSDSILLIIPLFFFFFSKSVIGSFNRFREESFLILSACALVFLSPLMAWCFFDQPYLTGLLLMRHNLCYLIFFMFVLLLRSRDQLDNFLRLLTFLLGVYIVILLVTKYFPTLGLVRFREGYYGQEGRLMRFGENRLYFPYANVAVLLYCFTLAGILHPPRKMSILRKTSALVFILIFLFAILSTFIRMLFVSLLFTTVFALFTSNRRMLRNMAIALTIVIICLEGLAVAVSQRGIPFIEESKLGKIILQSGKLPPDTGRMFQVSMYMNNFIKSPLTGVGTIKSGITHNEIIRTYRKYGFFNATDIGYLKMAAESGLIGIAWVAWFYSYLYRRGKETMKRAIALGDEPMAEAVARGLRYFLIYLAISGLTFPHFVYFSFIPAIVLALAIMAVTRESLRFRTAAPATA